MAAGKIQFYHEIMNTTIMDGFRDYLGPLPRVSFASFKSEMSKGPVRERVCTWVLK